VFATKIHGVYQVTVNLNEQVSKTTLMHFPMSNEFSADDTEYVYPLKF
jgi:hypothetical protein